MQPFLIRQWSEMLQRWDEWGSPIRPSAEDVEMFARAVGDGGHRLLLGVTPELRHLATVSIDNNPVAIETDPLHTVFGDWGDLPFSRQFDRIIGDGCLNIFQGDPSLIFQEAKKVLKPGGRLILRVFVSPEEKEPLDWVLRNRGDMGFHAFKLRVGHAMANPYVRVKDRCDVIRSICDHPTLSVYEDSDLIYYFPKLSELPPWDEIQFGKSYELSERCPVITWILS